MGFSVCVMGKGRCRKEWVRKPTHVNQMTQVCSSHAGLAQSQQYKTQTPNLSAPLSLLIWPILRKECILPYSIPSCLLICDSLLCQQKDRADTPVTEYFLTQRINCKRNKSYCPSRFVSCWVDSFFANLTHPIYSSPLSR